MGRTPARLSSSSPSQCGWRGLTAAAVGLVLPQSIVGARDAAPVRADVARMADLTWSWWAPRQRHFDAEVNVCALGFERPSTDRHRHGDGVWTSVVTDRLGIPELERSRLACAGTLGERAELNANFRDEYYALVPAVHEGGDGPPLVTSGLIDPGICLWGQRAMTFAAPHVHSPPGRPHAADRPLPEVGGTQTRS